jgi:hypothetical protein
MAISLVAPEPVTVLVVSAVDGLASFSQLYSNS